MTSKNSALVLMLSMFLAACGGSSGGSESFFDSIAGVYYTDNGLLRINSDGNYIAVNTLNNEGAIGLETGKFTRDSEQITVTIFKDFQENCAGDITKATGFSFNDTNPKLEKKNGKLYVNDEELTALEGNGIIGGWAAAEVVSTNEDDSHKESNAATNIAVDQMYLLPGGKFILAYPADDNSHDERAFATGSYAHSEATKTLNLIFDHKIIGINDVLCQEQLQQNLRHGEDETMAFYGVDVGQDILTYKGDHEDDSDRIITEIITSERIKTKL